MKACMPVAALMFGIVLGTSSFVHAQQTPAPLRAGRWEYQSSIVVSIKGQTLRKMQRKWHICNPKTGEPPLVLPQGRTPIHCGDKRVTPTDHGLHAQLTCTTSNNGSVNTIVEDLDVTPGPDGTTSTVNGTVDTRVGGGQEDGPPLRLTVHSKGRWVGQCKLAH